MFWKNLVENSYTKAPKCRSISEMLLKNKRVMKTMAEKMTNTDKLQPTDLLNLLSRQMDKGLLSLNSSYTKTKVKL